MELKLVKVPFEVELAKKIANGEVDGRIVTDNGNVVRIVCFDMLDDKGRIIGLRKDDNYKEIALTKDKRESPRLKSWDESASMFFLILDISDYDISRNTSDRLAEIRPRPQCG